MQKPYLIGIAGGSAAGKTFFLKSVRNVFSENEVCIISQDNYYRPAHYQVTDEQGMINFDLPEGIDDTRFLRDIDTLAHSLEVVQEEYMFNQPGVKGGIITLKPAPVVMVEGLFIFHFPEIRKLLNVKIFLDAKEDLKLQRRLKRDTQERGLTEETVLYQWHNHVVPSFNSYLLPYREEADIIITNNESFDTGFNILRDHIHSVLRGPAI